MEEISQSLKKLENQNEFYSQKYSAAILDTISEYIQLLNSHYGEERHPDRSLGGWAAVLIDRSLETIETEYKNFLNKHRLTQDTAEIREPIAECQNSIHWILEIHISSDFHYILVYPCKD